jgi:hypothetical protein
MATPGAGSGRTRSDGEYLPSRASEAVTQATLSTFLLPVTFEALGYFSYARY